MSIQEYVSRKVIHYLEEKEEELDDLKDILEKASTTEGDIRKCKICKKYEFNTVSYRDYILKCIQCKVYYCSYNCAEQDHAFLISIRKRMRSKKKIQCKNCHIKDPNPIRPEYDPRIDRLHIFPLYKLKPSKNRI